MDIIIIIIVHIIIHMIIIIMYNVKSNVDVFGLKLYFVGDACTIMYIYYQFNIVVLNNITFTIKLSLCSICIPFVYCSMPYYAP